jgi:histidyl-tRNA synthetase
MKPSIPKGTRDFGPSEMVKRNYIFDTIKVVFKKYGFLPLETPSMEQLSTLMGKYGEEGDKLIFKILNSGNYLDGVDETAYSNKDVKKLTLGISEKALRYDLTVPFARFVVMHQHELAFPFRRYQIQPVWRADKPQKGRYREFYQCDADVIGSDSLLNELDLIELMNEVFSNLNLNVTLLINNRKVLAGIAEVIGATDKMIDITVAIDKLDKIGIDKVKEELRVKGLSEEAIDKLSPLLSFNGNTAEKVALLKSMLSNSEVGCKGIEEIETLFGLTDGLNLSHLNIQLDLTLARGLNYYTGAIFEVKVNEPAINFSGSICGGGRYDDLTGIFGLKGMSGVGISFGADRIYDVLDELKLFPAEASQSTKVLIVNFGEVETTYALTILRKLRSNNIAAEIYPDAAKLKKQFTYADNRTIPFVIIAGSDEIAANTFVLKNMSSGEQKTISINDDFNTIFN